MSESQTGAATDDYRSGWERVFGSPDPTPGSTGPLDRTFADLAAEIIYARLKFPRNRFLLAALVEEVGELADAILNVDGAAIRKEAIQVACVAVRIAEEGDSADYQDRRGVQGILLLASAVGRVARFLLQRQRVLVTTSAEDAAHAAIWIREHGDTTFLDVTDDEAKP